MDSILIKFEKRARENNDFTPKMKDILQTSLHLFSEKGYSNTSTSDIAKSAKVAEGTIFKHFGSKENLLYSTLLPLLKLSLVEEWEEQLSDVIQNITDYTFESFLREVLQTKIIHAEDSLKVFKIVTMEYLYQEELRKKLQNLIPQNIVKDINNLLNYFKEEGQIVNLPNKELIRFLLGTLMSFVLNNNINPSTKETKKIELEHMVVFLTQGLSPKK